MVVDCPMVVDCGDVDCPMSVDCPIVVDCGEVD